MSTSIENALLDVRKAYRLLSDYQQRVLELLCFIREELQATHYHQHFRNKAPRSLERLERNDKGGQWLLPFSDISLLWLKNSGQDDAVHLHHKGDMLIDVWVRSDTGNGEYGETTMQPEQSCSELRFYFIKCEEPKAESCNWYYQIWSKTDYPPLGEVAQCDVAGYRAYGEAISLADLTDEAAVRDSITALRQRVSTKLEQII